MLSCGDLEGRIVGLGDQQTTIVGAEIEGGNPGRRPGARASPRAADTLGASVGERGLVCLSVHLFT